MNKMKGGQRIMNNKIVGAVLIVAILVLGSYLFFGSSSAVVSAVGTSNLDVEPDQVSIYISVEGRGPDAETAKNEFDSIKDELVFSLIKLGFDRDEILTKSFNVYPEYNWDEGKRELIGYVASESIIIESEDFDSVSDVVDTAIDSGALVSWINFELSDDRQKEFKAQALEDASKDARTKAEATARGLGKGLGSVVSVQSQDYGYAPYRYYDSFAVAEDGAAGASVQEATINLSPRDVTVSASVRVEYKLRAF